MENKHWVKKHNLNTLLCHHFLAQYYLYIYEGLDVGDDPITQISYIPTFPPGGDKAGNAGKTEASFKETGCLVVKGSLRRANSLPILKTRLTLQKRGAQSPLCRTVTVSTSPTRLGVSV